MNKKKNKSERDYDGRATLRIRLIATRLTRSAVNARVATKGWPRVNNESSSLTKGIHRQGWGQGTRILRAPLEMIRFCGHNWTHPVRVQTRVMGLFQNCRWEAGSTRLYHQAAEVRLSRVVRRCEETEMRTVSPATCSQPRTPKAGMSWILLRSMELDLTGQTETCRNWIVRTGER